MAVSKFRTLVKAGFASAALLALAGCASNALIGATTYRPSYVPGENNRYGPVQVVVRGTPFAANVLAASVPATVLGDIRGQGFTGATFALNRVDPRSPYVVALLFGPGAAISDQRVCAGSGPAFLQYPPQAVPQVGDRVHVQAILCRSTERLASAEGWLTVPARPDDPKFVASLGDFIRAIFPAVNPDNDNGNVNYPM